MAARKSKPAPDGDCAHCTKLRLQVESLHWENEALRLSRDQCEYEVHGLRGLYATLTQWFVVLRTPAFLRRNGGLRRVVAVAAENAGLITEQHHQSLLRHLAITRRDLAAKRRGERRRWKE
jgi:hypothetical protein